MNQKLKIVLLAAAFALLIAAASLAYSVLSEEVDPGILLAEQEGTITTSDAQNEDSQPERIEAPDFTVEDADGNSAKLSDFRGKPVVLNFWASWCPPCKTEMPDFDTVWAELGSEVTFLMVNLTDGQRETRKTASDYIAAQSFGFPVYFDTAQEAAYTYGIRSIPTTIFIDSEGYIVTGAEGQLDEKTLRYGISLIQD